MIQESTMRIYKTKKCFILSNHSLHTTHTNSTFFVEQYTTSTILTSFRFPWTENASKSLAKRSFFSFQYNHKYSYSAIHSLQSLITPTLQLPLKQTTSFDITIPSLSQTSLHYQFIPFIPPQSESTLSQSRVSSVYSIQPTNTYTEIDDMKWIELSEKWERKKWEGAMNEIGWNE